MKHENLRIGNGYDIHRLVENRKLILGGIEIPFEKGLLGHSDADVLVHAIMDALLGALSLGDIGCHFPPSEPEFKDISSLKLLEKVYSLIKSRNYIIINIDSVIQAEKPKLKDYIPYMKQAISGILEIESDKISIKATTMEGLGPIGEGNAIASSAIALLIKM
ncbi:MAG TPA: 2-C-methyl-D-erythritol 2,4-cyclodiphosphate synthase [Candidatus Gastranaerophilales bacterium]|nr:2-C-methyl-D-erythritol 2,4-cyclodiphosphate synthase [Candidatus Gastranaerophilales bacterium]